MASIMITMLMMVVISLIVLGFAQVSRRERQQATDRQLSSQAFFAAESAVNDVRSVVQSMLARGEPVPEKTDCETSESDTTTPYKFNPVIDDVNKVSYSCLLVSTRVDTLVGQVAANGNSVKLPLESATDPIDTLSVNWRAASTPSSVAGCRTNIPNSGYFDAAASWGCPYGVLRLELVPTASLDSTALAAGHTVMFLYPTRTGGTSSTPLANGRVAEMRCSTTGGCNVDITGFNAARYAVKISSVYVGGTFSLSATDSGGDPLQFQNGQVLVDVTGKASDVLRRIQVRLPMAGGPSTPDYAIQSAGSLCKRFEFDVDSLSIPADLAAQDQRNPMCRPLQVLPPPPPTCPVQKDIIVLMDTSNSMGNDEVAPGVTRFEKAKEIILRFFDETQLGVTNNEGVLGFSYGVTFRQNLTTSRTALRNAVNNADMEYGTTFIPILNAAHSAFSLGSYRPTAQKVIVFFSDGEANEETDADIWARANQIKAAGRTIYTVSIGDPSSRSGPRFQTLRGIASTVGGQLKYYDGRDSAALDTIVDQLTAELRCQTPVAP